jgi:NDP-sugar pyrophosphorylase family protein
MSNRAVILAGGMGTRLKPYTIALPKPLVPVGEKPILEIIINQLNKQGFDHITISVNHMSDIIKAFFNDGSKWGIKIDYTIEEKPLSTMGPLTLIPDLPENFLVMNGDVLTDIDFRLLFNYHVENRNNFTIASSRRKDRIDYGVLTSDDQNRLVKFEEKPFYEFLVSMGIYIVNKRIVGYIPENTYFGFDHLMELLIIKGEPPFIYEYNGRWLDIGRPDDYEKAAVEMEKKAF